jgi:DNA-binding transcriptional regulator YiaG
MAYSHVALWKHEDSLAFRGVEQLTAPFCLDAMAPPCIASNWVPRAAFRVFGNDSLLRLQFPATCHRLRKYAADPKQKRERFKQLTQNPKVKIGKAFAADVRKSRIHPTVEKLTAWRKANRLSQPKAVAVLGQYYFHITFASLRSWKEGRRSPNHILPGSLKNFCPTIRS